MANITAGSFAEILTSTTDWDVDHASRTYEYTGSDAFVQFAANFSDDLPATLIVPRLSQRTGGVTISIENSNIVFTAGSIEFGDVGLNVYSGTGNISAAWNIQNCNIVATNGAVNGWGQAGSGGQNSTGSVSNNNFVAIGADTRWFINHQGATGITFEGNAFTQGVFNSALGVALTGGDFDGTTRQHLGGQYTFRRNSPIAGTAYVMFHGNTFRGTAYRDIAGSGQNQTSIYQGNIGAGLGGLTEYSLNNRVEDSNMGAQRSGTTSMTFLEGYTWNPTYSDAGTGADIADVHVLGLPSTTRVPQATVDFTTDPALATNGAASPTGYIFQVGTGTLPTEDIIVIFDKARNLDGTLVSTQEHTIRLKSFSHLLDTTTTTQINDIASSVLNTGDTWAYQNEHSFAAAQDPAVGTYTLGTVPAAIGDGDDLYPAMRKEWVEGSVNESFGVSIVNGVITTTKDITLGTTNSYTASDLTFNVPTVLTATAGITGIAGGSIAIGGKGFDGITINGATTGNFGALTNRANITTSATTAFTVASMNDSDIDSVASLSITGALDGTGTVTSDGTITLSNSTAASDYEFDAPIVAGVNTGTFVDGITFKRSGGDLAMAVNFVVPAGEYTIDNLLGTNFAFEPGDVITLNSDNAIDVLVPNKTTIAFTAGNNVAVTEADSMLDFSQYTMNDSTWANDIKISFSLANDVANPIQLNTGNVVVLSASTFVTGSDYIFTVTKPGWSTSRSMVTYAPGETFTVNMSALDAVDETQDITGVAFTYQSKTSDQIRIVMNGAPTSNALNGERSVWAIEQVKNILEYNQSVHTYGLTNLNIGHSSGVESLWNGDYLLLEPGTQNQQVLGWGRSNPSAAIITDNAANLSIFINDSAEINYGSVGTAVDNSATGTRVEALRTNKLLGLKPQNASSGGDFSA